MNIGDEVETADGPGVVVRLLPGERAIVCLDAGGSVIEHDVNE